MTSKYFGRHKEYRNYVPVEKVRNESRVLESRSANQDLRIDAAEELRRMAHAHALASEAAKAQVWTASNDELQTAMELATASGQLFLRSSRQERMHLSDDPEHVERIYHDRINAALEFLAAKRQAIAAAIARDVPMYDKAVDSIAAVQVITAICNAIGSGGRPDPNYLEREMKDLTRKIYAEADRTRAYQLAISGIALEYLCKFGQALDTGELQSARKLAKEHKVVEKLLARIDEDAADIFGRYFSNANWIVDNSVWNLPHDVDLGGQAATELVQSLLKDRKPFLFPAQ